MKKRSNPGGKEIQQLSHSGSEIDYDGAEQDSERARLCEALDSNSDISEESVERLDEEEYLPHS